MKRVLVAAPRSFCAGVVRAIDIVEKLLEQHGPPVYVRHEIVHNVHVVRDLEARGAVFVESEDEVPEGELIVLSAHGVAPKVYEKCAERGLQVVDAVCPLVSKVHAEARRYAGRGLKIALVGHAGHVEVEGTMGEAPDSIVLVETPEDARALEVEDGEQVAYITQTTLSLDDTADVVDTLRERFPGSRRAAVRRHLLRDAEPPGRGQAHLRGGDARARRRLAHELERQPPGGGRSRPGRRCLPHRRRGRPRPGLAGGPRDGRADRGRIVAGAHRRPRLRAARGTRASRSAPRSRSPAKTSSSACRRIFAPNSA